MSRWIAAALVLIASPAAAAEERDFDTALRDFRVLHRSETSRARIAGSSFYVVRDGRTVAADHLGEQDADAHVPVDARTIYHWASITKTMTGIAIMQLRDRACCRSTTRSCVTSPNSPRCIIPMATRVPSRSAS